MLFLQRLHEVPRTSAEAGELPVPAEPALAGGHGACPFGPSGAMDDDGYSTPCSYAEKASIERTLLASLERRMAEARDADLHDVLVATSAYADDLRDRIARFDELEDDVHR
jgi:hypothetical protein